MKSLISWFAKNPIAANLLAVLLVVSGILSLSTIEQESYPDVSAGVIAIVVIHPGAAPDDVEEQICVPIEEAVYDLPGVKRISSTAREGAGYVYVEFRSGTDAPRLIDNIDSRIAVLDSLPADAKSPIISEVINWSSVVDVAVVGGINEIQLKRVAQRVRDDLISKAGITRAEVVNARPDEISIEVSESVLRRHAITFDTVTRAVRSSSVEVAGGILKTEGGDLRLRASGRAYDEDQFSDVVVLTRPDGTRLRLGDIARVEDGLAESEERAFLDGEPVLLIRVFRGADERILDIAELVAAYMRNAPQWLPDGVHLELWNDQSLDLESRQTMLIENALVGVALVVLVLTLFLRFQVGFWVGIGIPISFLGTIAIMEVLGISLNLMTLMAFVLAIGLVVDDGIVISEQVVQRRQEGMPPLAAAIRGTQQVAVPVLLAALTTIVFVIPTVFLEGMIGKQSRPTAIVVCVCLAISLVEAFLVLPAHLARQKISAKEVKAGVRGSWSRTQEALAASFERIAKNWVLPQLEVAIRWRYAVMAGSVAIVLLTLGVVAGGHMPIRFFPDVEGNHATALLRMPRGTPPETTLAAARFVERQAERLKRELVDAGHPGVIRHVLTSVGNQPEGRRLHAYQPTTWEQFRQPHLAEVQVELVPAEERSISSEQVASRWRELTGQVPGAVDLSYVVALFPTGAPIGVELASRDHEALLRATEDLKARLHGHPGFHSVADNLPRSKDEVQLTIRPEGEAVGLSLAELGRQIRQGFHGEVVQRIRRGRDEAEVVVRYPEDERRSLGGLDQIAIRTQSGDEVPFATVAEARRTHSIAEIHRADRRRVVKVTAKVDSTVASTSALGKHVLNSILPAVLQDHPEVEYGRAGQLRDQQEFFQRLLKLFAIALLIAYALLSIPLRSYSQPFVVMTAIPFCLVGGVVGHRIVGIDLSAFSFIGVFAAAGVAMNDTLVLLYAVRQLRERGLELAQAIREAVARRLRPIVLTTVTTSVGLLPLIAENSSQANWLKPMAVSLVFAEIVSTPIIIFLVPVALVIVTDLRKLLGRRQIGEDRLKGVPEPVARRIQTQELASPLHAVERTIEVKA